MLTEFLEILAILLAFRVLIKEWRLTKLGTDCIRWPTYKSIDPQKPQYLQQVQAEVLSKNGSVSKIKMSGHDTILLSSFKAMKAVMSNNRLACRRPETVNPTGNENGITWGSGGCHWSQLKTRSKQQLRHVCMRSRFLDKTIIKEAHKLISSVPTSGLVLLKIEKSKLYTTCQQILMYIIFGRNANCDMNEVQYKITNNNPFTSNFIKKKMSAILTDNSATEWEDVGFIDAFLMRILHEDDFQNEQTVQQLSAVALDMLLSGTEPIAEAIYCMIQLLAQNPQVQTKIFQEIRSERSNEHSHTNLMEGSKTYRMATLFEVFRVGNVLPGPLPRMATEPFIINGINVSVGDRITYDLEHVFKDESYWGESVLEFMPERFIDSSSNKLVKTERMVMFGFGKRSCLGEAVVWKTLLTYLTSVICENLELSSDQRIPVKLVNNSVNIYALRRSTINQSDYRCD